MPSVFRLALAALVALFLTIPASAGQPTGSAAWTTAGWVSFNGTLYAGPGKRYDAVGTVDEGARVRVDRCSKRWCQIHTASLRGWLSLDNLSFGQAPDGPFRGPQFGFNYGGTVCFYEGEGFTGASFCAKGGRVFEDLALVGRDNRISSIEVGGGSVLVCRDRGFRSYCERINEDKSSVDGLLNNAISSARVY